MPGATYTAASVRPGIEPARTLPLS